MRLGRLLVASVLAGTMILASSHAAEASPAAQTAPQSATQTEQAAQAAAEELQRTGFVEFIGADGQAYQARLAEGILTISSEASAESDSPASGATSDYSLWCDLKVAAAITAISAVGIGFVAWMIAGLPETTVVVIAGIALRVITWRTIVYLWGAGVALTNYLSDVLC